MKINYLREQICVKLAIFWTEIACDFKQIRLQLYTLEVSIQTATTTHSLEERLGQTVDEFKFKSSSQIVFGTVSRGKILFIRASDRMNF
jgi:hypothetical protein